LWRDAKKNPPAIILCGKALFEARIAYYLHLYFGIPYVIFTYAMELTEWSESPRTAKQLRQVLGKAHRIIYINDTSGQLLRDLGVREERLVKIWPGVDDSFFKEVTDSEKKELWDARGISKNYILSVGRLVPRKGFDTLIAGYAKLTPELRQNYQLVIAGRGERRQSLREHARELGVGEDVIFLGSVSDKELRVLYGGATCFALTPKKIEGATEGFGIVYLEAAAQGLPVIGTHHGGITEAVLHMKTGILISPDDAMACGAALSELLHDPQLRQRLGSEGKERAWREFRWSKRILLVKGMLDAILAERVLARRHV
jgi:phosphatidylinositol alpha-1,6-mannosyltransferase